MTNVKKSVQFVCLHVFEVVCMCASSSDHAYVMLSDVQYS